MAQNAADTDVGENDEEASVQPEPYFLKNEDPTCYALNILQTQPQTEEVIQTLLQDLGRHTQLSIDSLFERLLQVVEARKLFVLFESKLNCNPQTDHLQPKSVLPLFHEEFCELKRKFSNLITMVIQNDISSSIREVVAEEIKAKIIFEQESFYLKYQVRMLIEQLEAMDGLLLKIGTKLSSEKVDELELIQQILEQARSRIRTGFVYESDFRDITFDPEKARAVKSNDAGSRVIKRMSEEILALKKKISTMEKENDKYQLLKLQESAGEVELNNEKKKNQGLERELALLRELSQQKPALVDCECESEEPPEGEYYTVQEMQEKLEQLENDTARVRRDYEQRIEALNNQVAGELPNTAGEERSPTSQADLAQQEPLLDNMNKYMRLFEIVTGFDVGSDKQTDIEREVIAYNLFDDATERSRYLFANYRKFADVGVQAGRRTRPTGVPDDKTSAEPVKPECGQAIGGREERLEPRRSATSEPNNCALAEAERPPECESSSGDSGFCQGCLADQSLILSDDEEDSPRGGSSWNSLGNEQTEAQTGSQTSYKQLAQQNTEQREEIQRLLLAIDALKQALPQYENGAPDSVIGRHDALSKAQALVEYARQDIALLDEHNCDRAVQTGEDATAGLDLEPEMRRQLIFQKAWQYLSKSDLTKNTISQRDSAYGVYNKLHLKDLELKKEDNQLMDELRGSERQNYERILKAYRVHRDNSIYGVLESKSAWQSLELKIDNRSYQPAPRENSQQVASLCEFTKKEIRSSSRQQPVSITPVFQEPQRPTSHALNTPTKIPLEEKKIPENALSEQPVSYGLQCNEKLMSEKTFERNSSSSMQDNSNLISTLPALSQNSAELGASSADLKKSEYENILMSINTKDSTIVKIKKDEAAERESVTSSAFRSFKKISDESGVCGSLKDSELFDALIDLHSPQE